MLIILFVSTILAGLTFVYPIWESEALDGVGFLVILVWLLYYGILIGVSAGISILSTKGCLFVICCHTPLLLCLDNVIQRCRFLLAYDCAISNELISNLLI